MRKIVIAALILALSSGCGSMGDVAEKKAETELTKAEAEKIAAEGTAAEKEILAQGQAAALEIAAGSSAQVDELMAKVQLENAVTDSRQAQANMALAAGMRDVLTASADQVGAYSENIRAQAEVTRAQAKRTVAESWAVYGLIVVAGVLALGFAIFLIQAGAALVRRSRALPSQQRHRVLDVPQRPGDDRAAIEDTGGAVGKLVALSLKAANHFEQNRG